MKVIKVIQCSYSLVAKIPIKLIWPRALSSFNKTAQSLPFQLPITLWGNVSTWRKACQCSIECEMMIYLLCSDLNCWGEEETYLLTYLLTYSMVQSPSWEVNWFAATQEIPRISRNPKVHYRTHKRPPPVSILGQPNPVRIPTSHLLEIHPNIIHPSTPRPPQWSPSLRFPHQDHIHPLSSPIRATWPAQLHNSAVCCILTTLAKLRWR